MSIGSKRSFWDIQVIENFGYDWQVYVSKLTRLPVKQTSFRQFIHLLLFYKLTA